VRMPIRFFAMTTLLYQASEFVIPDEPQRRQVYAACASLAACGESRNPVTTAAVYWIPDSRASTAPRNDESVFVRFGISAFSSTRPQTLCASGPLSRGGGSWRRWRRTLASLFTISSTSRADGRTIETGSDVRPAAALRVSRIGCSRCAPGPLFNDNRLQLAIGANAARPRRRRD
jgi:hypothetical protein